MSRCLHHLVFLQPKVLNHDSLVHCEPVVLIGLHEKVVEITLLLVDAHGNVEARSIQSIQLHASLELQG